MKIATVNLNAMWIRKSFVKTALCYNIKPKNTHVYPIVIGKCSGGESDKTSQNCKTHKNIHKISSFIAMVCVKKGIPRYINSSSPSLLFKTVFFIIYKTQFLDGSSFFSIITSKAQQPLFYNDKATPV